MKFDKSTHPDGDALSSFLRGQVDDDELVWAIESHLSQCEQCQEVAAGITPDNLETTIKDLYQSTKHDQSDAFSEYVLGAEIGRGGAGVVYRATQPRLNRTVALKMLVHSEHIRESDLARFRRESTALSTLDHPNIVTIFDCGEQSGQPYIAMELVEGTTLDKCLTYELPTAQQTTELLIDLADAIAHAHEKGIFHRDLKPQNILVKQNSNGSSILGERINAKIVDFGLSQLLDEQYATRTGQILGTPSYMAPETAVGASSEVNSAKVDIYGLGAVMYQCLTGRPPFVGENQVAILRHVCDQEPVSINTLRPDVPIDLRTICERCLSKTPDKRFDSADALKNDLCRYLEGKPIVSRRVQVHEKVAKWVRRNLWQTAAGLLFVGLVSLFIIGLIWNQSNISRERDIANQNYQSARETILNMLAATDQQSVMEIAQLRELSLQQTNEALALYEQLAGIEDTVQAKLDLATVKMRAGTIHVANGQFEQGMEILQSSATSLQDLLDENPDNQRISRDLVGNQIKVAAAFAGQNRNKDAIALLKPLVPIAKKLRTDPGNVEQTNLLTWLLHNLGNAATGANDHSEAAEYYGQEITLLNEALAIQPDNLELHRLLNEAEICQGMCWMVLKKPDQAKQSYQNAIDSLIKIQESKPADTAVRISIAIAYLNMTSLYGSNDAQRTWDICEKGIQQLQPLVASDPDHYQARQALAMLYGNRAIYCKDQDQNIRDWQSAMQITPDKDTRDYSLTMLLRHLVDAERWGAVEWMLPRISLERMSDLNRFRQISVTALFGHRIKTEFPEVSRRINQLVETEMRYLRSQEYFKNNPAALEHVKTSEDYLTFRESTPHSNSLFLTDGS